MRYISFIYCQKSSYLNLKFTRNLNLKIISNKLISRNELKRHNKRTHLKSINSLLAFQNCYNYNNFSYFLRSNKIFLNKQILSDLTIYEKKMFLCLFVWGYVLKIIN